MSGYEQDSQTYEQILLERQTEAKRLLDLLRASEQKTPLEQFEFRDNYVELTKLLGVLNSMQGKESSKEDIGTNTDEINKFFNKINKSLS